MRIVSCLCKSLVLMPTIPISVRFLVGMSRSNVDRLSINPGDVSHTPPPSIGGRYEYSCSVGLVNGRRIARPLSSIDPVECILLRSLYRRAQTAAIPSLMESHLSEQVYKSGHHRVSSGCLVSSSSAFAASSCNLLFSLPSSIQSSKTNSPDSTVRIGWVLTPPRSWPTR